MDHQLFTEKLGPELDKATAQILKKKNQYKTTDVTLEIKMVKDESADMPQSKDGQEYPDYVAYIRLNEPKKGKKTASVEGAFPLEAWTDVMKYLRTVL